MSRQKTFNLLALMSATLCLFVVPIAAQENQPPVRINRTIEKLVKGLPVLGAVIYDFSLYAARQYATSPLDYVILDMEHSPLDIERLQTFLLGMTDKAAIAKQGNVQQRVVPIVRIPTYGRDINEFLVKQVLDAGAFGIMYPAIETKEQALLAVRAARYPPMKGAKFAEPRGIRGNGNMPGAWFWGLSRPEYSQRADVWPANPAGELLLLHQIETAEGVRNIDDILSVPGVGVILIGPNDLAYSLGVRDGSPELEAAIQIVLKACLAHNVSCAVTVTANDVARRLKEGFKMVALPSGGLEAQMDAAYREAQTVLNP